MNLEKNKGEEMSETTAKNDLPKIPVPPKIDVESIKTMRKITGGKISVKALLALAPDQEEMQAFLLEVGDGTVTKDVEAMAATMILVELADDQELVASLDLEE